MFCKCFSSKGLAEREGFYAALILKGSSISQAKFTLVIAKSKH